MKAIIAELMGTYALVLAGCGAVVVNSLHTGALGNAGIAAAFGLTVWLLIELFGPISGAHLNPAVSLGLAISGQLPWRLWPGYVSAQCLGAILASLTLWCWFGDVANLGSTQPSASVSLAFALELLLSAFLMAVVLRAGSASRGTPASLLIGATIALEALVAGPVTGASMNPARSLGPALISGQCQQLWLYLLAPCLGTLLVAAVRTHLQPQEPLAAKPPAF